MSTASAASERSEFTVDSTASVIGSQEFQTQSPEISISQALAAEESTHLVQCAISDRDQDETHQAQPASMEIRVYADMLEITRKPHQVTLSVTKPHTAANKREITDFTRRSRSRMFRAMAKIRNPGELTFMTLTYRDQEWFHQALTLRDFQRHLEIFCKRLEREFSGVGILWRKEYQDRKSGDHQGEIAPHAHLIVRNFTMRDDQALAWVKNAWSEITGAASESAAARVDVELARSRKHAYHYVSKYVAKIAENESEISEFFHKHAGDVGRHWGMRGNWDLSESITISLDVDVVTQIKRLVRSWLRSRGKRKFARIAAKIQRDFGLCVLGLGDQDSEPLESEVLRLVFHALSLAAPGGS